LRQEITLENLFVLFILCNPTDNLTGMRTDPPPYNTEL